MNVSKHDFEVKKIILLVKFLCGEGNSFKDKVFSFLQFYKEVARGGIVV